MAIHRSHKNRKTLRDKQNPNYNFLVSWKPTEAAVKRESNLSSTSQSPKLTVAKRAEIQAKEDSHARIKKDIIKSLILVSFVLIAEVVVYLARR